MKWSPVLVSILSLACRTSGPSAGTTPDAPTAPAKNTTSPERPSSAPQPSKAPDAAPPAPSARPAPTCNTQFGGSDPPRELCSIWGTDVEAGLNEARSTSRPTLLFFCSQWTSACKPMRQETLENDGVLQELTKHYQLVHVDATDVDDSKTTAVLQRFGITVFPQLIVVDPAGTVTLRLEGYATRHEISTNLGVSRDSAS